MLISTKGRYALRMLTDMAEHGDESFLPLREIAARQDISEKYLESIAKTLVKSGLLLGMRGRGGGYRLSRQPQQITLWQVLRVTEDDLAPVACLAPQATRCPRMADCRTLPVWRGLNDAIIEYLTRYTLADLMHTGASGDDYVI